MKENAKSGALTEVTFFILLSLYTRRHGYAIMQFIERRTAGRLTLGAGTLYGALQTLVARGWIKAIEQTENSRRKEYEITEVGRLVVEIERMRLQNLVILADEIMDT